MSVVWQAPPKVAATVTLEGETFRMAVVQLFKRPGKWALLMHDLTSTEALELAEQARERCPSLQVVARRRDGAEWGVWAQKRPEKGRQVPSDARPVLSDVEVPPALQHVLETRTEPTQEQEDILARMRRLNREHDEKMRAKEVVGKTGKLPGGCTQVGVTHVLPFLRPAAKAAVKAGWVIGMAGKHHKWCGPDGQTVTTPTTNTEGGSNVPTILSALKRAGVPVPEAHSKKKAA